MEYGQEKDADGTSGIEGYGRDQLVKRVGTIYGQISNTRRNKFQNSNLSRLALHLFLYNPMNPGVN